MAKVKEYRAALTYIHAVKDGQSSPCSFDKDTDDSTLQLAFKQKSTIKQKSTKKVAAIMPGDMSGSLAKKKTMATAFLQCILPAVNTAILLHVENNIKGGWKRLFPMTDLTLAACVLTNKVRDKKEDKRQAHDSHRLPPCL